MRSLPKLTFVIDDFSIGSPGQQLLDRFLIGYNRDGEFYSPGCAVELLQPKQNNDAIAARSKDFGLKIGGDLNQTQATVIVGTAAEHLSKLPRGARCFIYGTLADTAGRASELVTSAEEHGLALRTATAVSGAFQLPVLEVPSRLRKALAVTHGAFPDAELHALEALCTLGKAVQTPKVELLTGAAVWQSAYSSQWSDLFASAFSRSNTIQGDPLKDGRTQDVAGLRLVERLVPKPRAWLVGDESMQAAVFVMNGALEDLNVAFESTSGKLVSTQLYQPPPPALDHFSGLAGQIEDFFRQDAPPPLSPLTMFLPRLLESMRSLWEEHA
jgi:hypothetical protein